MGYRVLIAGLAALLAVPLLQAQASATVGCTYNAAQRRVNAVVANDTLELSRDTSGRILFGADAATSPCGLATVTNTDQIVVIGSTGTDNVSISERAGRFAPGATPESSGISEIEFSIDLGSDPNGDGVGIEAPLTGPGTIIFGRGLRDSRLAVTNLDGDVEVVMFGVEDYAGAAGDGPAFLSGQGGTGGTGAPLFDSLVLEGGGGDDTILGGLSQDALLGSGGDDVVDGFGGEDTVVGGAGVDELSGGSGDDDLFNVDGPGDFFIPGPGNDALTGSPAGTDTASFAGAPGPMNVNLGSQEATGEGDDALTSIESVIGSDFADTISGSSAPNALTGRAGDDVLQGAQDADTLFPGQGNDTARGGAGLDTIDFFQSIAAVVVNLGTGTATGQGTDSLETIENVVGSGLGDQLTGSAAANRLVGNNGADTIAGLEGDDVLDGGAGNDNLNGGPGTDQCVQGAGTGSLTLCENVGTFEVKPSDATVEAGQRIDYLVTWTHPRRWRRLDTVELRVRHGDRVLAWVRWNQEGNTFQLFDPRQDRFGAAAPGGNHGVLTSPFARLHLRGSDAEAFDTRTIAVNLRLSFRPAAVGEHVVEVTAEDDRNNRNAWEHAGTLKVSGR